MSFGSAVIRFRSAPAVAVILILGVSGCSAQQSGNIATGGPILVGNISSLTGPSTFPEASQAAKAVFDRVNKQGGINGRKIQYLIEDDRADPTIGAQAAHKLIDSEGVVAMAGSASVLDCAVNAKYYATSNIYSIQGTGVDPVCFNSPNISPVNTGPFLGVTVSLYFASEILKYSKVCRLEFFDIPGFDSAFGQALTDWEHITGKQPLYVARLAKPTDDPAPLVINAAQKGCQAVVIDGLEAHAVAVMRIVEAQGIKGIAWIGLTSYYTDKVGSTLGASGNGLYANSEFEPYGQQSAVLADWRQLMQQNSVPLTSFAEGGYLAATYFVQALQSIHGDITRDSVAKAMVGFSPMQSQMVGTPFTFGSGNAHASNRASKFVQLAGGTWNTVTDKWIVLPKV